MKYPFNINYYKDKGLTNYNVNIEGVPRKQKLCSNVAGLPKKILSGGNLPSKSYKNKKSLKLYFFRPKKKKNTKIFVSRDLEGSARIPPRYKKRYFAD